MARFRAILTLAGALSFSFLLVASGAGQTPNAPAGENPKQPEFELPQTPQSALSPAEQRGQGLYQYYCALCHGITGAGDGFNSSQLATPPAKHADATLMAALSDADMQLVIKKGGPALGRSPQMPPWGRVLTDRDVTDLAAFVRTLSKR